MKFSNTSTNPFFPCTINIFHNINSNILQQNETKKYHVRKLHINTEHSAHRIRICWKSLSGQYIRYFTLAYLRHICGSANMVLCHGRVIFGSAATWPESSKEPVRHCTSLAGVIVSDCTLISTLHSALPLLMHLSSISGLRKWDIHVLVGVKLLTYPM